MTARRIHFLQMLSVYSLSAMLGFGILGSVLPDISGMIALPAGWLTNGLTYLILTAGVLAFLAGLDAFLLMLEKGAHRVR